MQDTIFFGYRQAGKHFALLQRLPGLANTPIDQQGRANPAIAVAAALRTLDTLTPGGVEDAFALFDLENQAGGLEGYFKHCLELFLQRVAYDFSLGPARPTARPHAVR